MDIQIQSAGFDTSVTLVDFINQKVGKLSKFHDKIIDVDVHMSLDSHQKVKDKIVKMRCDIPNHKLFVETSAKSFEAAIAEATDDMARQIKKKKEMILDSKRKTS